MNDPLAPLELTRGSAWRNRVALAPMTNQQSGADGRLSDDELRWLEARAEGGFGLVMTCAAHVEARGQGFTGQLGVFGEEHEEGLARLAAALRAAGAVSSVQLHHAGRRAPERLTGARPVAPSDCEETGARALALEEVEAVREAFVEAALRCQRAGFDGVELHGAHDYLLCEFLSPATNRRQDRYGGSPEGRARLLREVIAGVRERCAPGFQLGLRLSPERYGLDPLEVLELERELLAGGALDHLDVSLWDVRKEAEDPRLAGRPLLEHHAALPRGGARLGVAGKVATLEDARWCLERGADFVLVGRAAILHHDLPRRWEEPGFRPAELPVSAAHLAAESVGPAFVDYLRRWEGFVAD
jgi:2,4-dienoyl-CoA reductase-like NADH-dependent reductase (Old Yellow Enzyme family)